MFGSDPTLSQLEAELWRRKSDRAEGNFHSFLKDFAWPAVTPGVPFADNWHAHAICEHLEAISSSQIKKLVINLPFRMLKSTIVSQAFPAWEWVRKPHLQFLTASYAKDISTRDAVASRRIIESPKYQHYWGRIVTLTSDQNVKTRYENSAGGTRIVTSTDGAATGFGGNRRIVDDPISAKEANSQAAIDTAIEWWRGTIATRANDPKNDAVIVVHQRVNERDLTGYILAEESGWDHLVLPMRYETANTKTTSLGFVDPRTVEGELMHPDRLPENIVVEMEKSLGAYHVNAQLQQRPESRAGNIFNRNHWMYYKVLPELDGVILSVDCTFKGLQTSDYVAIQAWGYKGAHKYLLHRMRAQLGFAATVQAIRSVKALHPKAITTLIEDKANGSAVIETLYKEIAGIIAVNPEGGKLSRAYAVQPEQEAGNIFLPDPSICPDIGQFLSELSAFPSMAFTDDEVDAFTQALNWLRTHTKRVGYLDYLKSLPAKPKQGTV